MDYFCNFDKLDYIKKKGAFGKCILCAISSENPEVTDVSVYRDDQFIVSLNLYPYNPGHLILFPRRHIEDIRELTLEEQETLNLLTRRFLDILDGLYAPAGYNIGYNMGKPAGASISHLHLHIIPRYPGEIGFADLIAGKRMLVEHPLDTIRRIKEALKKKSSRGR